MSLTTTWEKWGGGEHLQHPITKTIRMKASVTDVPATFDQLRPGVRVKCIYLPGAPCNGKTGTIKSIDSTKPLIEITWDDGDRRLEKWMYAYSFTVLAESPTPESTVSTTPAVNDHVCPTCQCDRVSKSELRCWRCGGNL